MTVSLTLSETRQHGSLPPPFNHISKPATILVKVFLTTHKNEYLETE